MKDSFAVIFDMDGVIIDSNPYHKKAWTLFLKKHGLSLTEDEFKEKIYGKTNDDIIKTLFNNKLTPKQIEHYSIEKELFFLNEYEPYILLTKGLESFLKQLTENNIKVGMATSAPLMNIDFVMTKTGIRKNFYVIVDPSVVAKGQPDPEIYIKTAGFMKVKPANCLVFEDSISGIESAKSAGMKAVGLTTTHSKKELSKLYEHISP